MFVIVAQIHNLYRLDTRLRGIRSDREEVFTTLL